MYSAPHEVKSNEFEVEHIARLLFFFKIFLCDGVPGSVLKLLFVFNDMKSLLQVAVYDDKSWWWFTSSNILSNTVLSDIFYFSNQICNMTTF